MDQNRWEGDLVRLTAEEPEISARARISWDRDSEYRRMIENGGINLWSVNKVEEWAKKELEDPNHRHILFWVRTQAENRLIGFVEMHVPWRFLGEGWLAIGLGERNFWGKGYGSEAIRLVLRYAFEEMNLYRITLGVHDYNQRARRAYEKVGFREEGRVRGEVKRDGSRADGIMMGILRDDWQNRIDKKVTM